MIVSHAHRFVFFHNPKAGGTSVRQAIEGLNDVGFGLWGADPSQTGGAEVDRAHMGIDEFAGHYPDLWETVQGYRMFCLCRDPRARFLSSVSEHSKNFGAADLRFTDPATGRDILFHTIDMLSGFAGAEDPRLMADIRLTHFRPQHIYWRSGRDGVAVEAFATRDIPGFLAAVSDLAGTPLEARHENAARSYRLPGPLQRLSRSGALRRGLSRLPGGTKITGALKSRYAAKTGRGLALDAKDEARITDFVQDFYALDYKTWPLVDRPA